MRQLRQVSFLLCAAALIGCLLAAALYRTIPLTNTTQTQFDTLIVLGNPANPDGTAAPEQRSRVAEAVREYQNHVANHIIMTGGAAHNRYVEAQVMASIAEASGVPAADIFQEGQAQNTIQNAFYSVRIMRAHHWHSAEVVSSPSHLPRASLIFRHFPIEWHMHAAPWPAEYSSFYSGALFLAESLYCSKLRILGFPRSQFLPHDLAE